MKLDVIIATFNRSSVLRRAMSSLFEAERTPDLEVVITIVDTSTDDTRQVVEEFQRRNEIEVRYIFEPRRGKSRALNTGIEQSTADLIGLTDDDIEVAPNWYVEIARLFRERWDEIDYVGGKVLPRWEVPPPAWLPSERPGVLSLHDHGDEEIVYSQEFEGQLTGAHGILKLSTLKAVGPYNENLGPMGGSLLGSEDDEMYIRLLGAGFRGIYYPKLSVYHRVPAYRLTKKYYRKWCYGWGRAQSQIDMEHPAYQGPRILGVPRYMYGDVGRNTSKWVRGLLKRDAGQRFNGELSLWVFMGFFYARNLQRSPLNSLIQSLRGKRAEQTR
ncbi:MAG TPA: glycosyltransferase [Pyrinomonadaceae bacterium]|nr:glycosyltransferase [Pyrinomonadaceae bacterium]